MGHYDSQKSKKRNFLFCRNRNFSLCVDNDLPLFLLDGKKERDQIELVVSGVPIRLRCIQLAYRYRRCAFDEMLQQLKENFIKRPNYFCGDKQEKQLIQAGVLEAMDGQRRHGPRDFRWLIRHRQSRPERAIAWASLAHPRLGVHSPARVLIRDLTKHIFELAENLP